MQKIPQLVQSMKKKMSKCVTVLSAVVNRHLHSKKKIGCKHIFKNLNRYVKNTSTCLEHGKKCQNVSLCYWRWSFGHLFQHFKKEHRIAPARQLSSDITNGNRKIAAVSPFLETCVSKYIFLCPRYQKRMALVVEFSGI